MTPNVLKPAGMLLAMCALTLLFSLPGHTQGAATPAIDGPPDVLVIVYQQPGAADQVNVTYASTVSHAQALADCRALIQATGWPSSTPSVKDAAAPVRNRTGLMTGVTFQALGVVQNAAHTFPIETFARAFHNYRRLNVVFLVGPQFQFQGARSYADANIRMTLDQRSTSYVYQIEILHPNFGSLPLSPALAKTQSGAGVRSFGIVNIFIIALLAGLLVYFIASQLTQLATQKSKPQDDASSKTESQPEVTAKK